MLLFLVRNGRLQFSVLVTLLLFMGMMPNQGFGQDPPPAVPDAASGAGNETGGGGGNATGRAGLGKGNPMPNLKCFACHHSKGNEDKDCEVGNAENLKKDKTTTCDGVCVKTVLAGSVSRGCQTARVEELKCHKSAKGLCQVVEKDVKDMTQDEKDKLEADYKKNKNAFETCLLDNNIDKDLIGYREGNKYGYGKSGDDVKLPFAATCWCDSEYCNPADHSSPNKKLIFAISMMTTVYLTVFKLN